MPARNGWPTSVGIGGRIASESVADFHRITQSGTGGLCCGGGRAVARKGCGWCGSCGPRR